MKTIRNILFAAIVTMTCVGEPSLARAESPSPSATIFGKLINNTSRTITIADARWTGRYGTARPDGTVGDRIEGPVAPGGSVSSRHRMGDAVQLGERYTELSFRAVFTDANGQDKKCRFWYSFKTDTGEYSAAVASSEADDKPYPTCKIVRNSYYDFSFIVEEGTSTQ